MAEVAQKGEQRGLAGKVASADDDDHYSKCSPTAVVADD